MRTPMRLQEEVVCFFFLPPSARKNPGSDRMVEPGRSLRRLKQQSNLQACPMPLRVENAPEKGTFLASDT